MELAQELLIGAALLGGFAYRFFFSYITKKENKQK